MQALGRIAQSLTSTLSERGLQAWWALALARRLGKCAAVLFAVGAVSGTVLSFELGLLWPGFMEFAGPIIGMPFSLEGFAFFTEAIFLGIYLYGWGRMPPGRHVLMVLPMAALFFVAQKYFIQGIVTSGRATKASSASSASSARPRLVWITVPVRLSTVRMRGAMRASTRCASASRTTSSSSSARSSVRS